MNYCCGGPDPGRGFPEVPSDSTLRYSYGVNEDLSVAIILKVNIELSVSAAVASRAECVVVMSSSS